MPMPGINSTVTTNNLVQAVDVLDSVPCFVLTLATAGLQNVITEVYTLTEAEEKGITETAEPFAHYHIKEYFSELGGSQRLLVYGQADTVTMAETLDSTEATGLINALQDKEGEISMVAIARNPDVAYDGGAGFLDADVEAAVLKVKTLALDYQQKNTPFRIFIEGRIIDEDIANTFTPNEATNNFAAVVLGGTKADGSASVGLALARATKYAAQIKLGSGANGALSVPSIYIGTKPYKQRTDIVTLHDEGFLTFQKRPNIAGFFFARDFMCSSDDFYILAHGRVIDKAQRISAEVYAPYIETDVDLDPDGSIDDDAAFALEQVLEQSILATMGEQISAVKVVIDPLQTGVLTASNLTVQISVQPKGYLTFISLIIGLTATI